MVIKLENYVFHCGKVYSLENSFLFFFVVASVGSVEMISNENVRQSLCRIYKMAKAKEYEMP